MSADFSAFANQTFDTASWINTTINERPEDEALEAYLASLAMKLHIISQDYTDQLETGMVEATTIMPRILGEVSRIEDVLKSLESEMNTLAAQVKAFDQRNVVGVEELSRLDTLKSNIEKCKATLEEHARWSQLVREAKTFMESGGRLSDSADRLEVMFKSCEVLKNMPSHNERITTCEAFRESLLSALRPRVRQDVSISDIHPLHEYLYVYDKLSKGDEFEEEYTKASPERFKTKWENHLDGNSFLLWFNSYMNKLASFFCDEFESAKKIFGDARAPFLLCSIIKHTMDPTRELLAENLKLLGLSSIASESFLLADKCAGKFLSHLESVEVNKRFESFEAYFGPFIDFMDNYVDLEASSIKSSLESIVGDIIFKGIESESDEFSDPDRDTIQVFEAYAERFLRVVNDSYDPIYSSIKRSSSYLNGIRVKPIFRSLSVTIINFIRLLLGKISELRDALGIEADPSADQNKNSKSNFNESNQQEDKNTSSPISLMWLQKLKSQGIEFVSVGAGRQMIPCVLRILQSSGRLVQRIIELEEESSAALFYTFNSLFRDNFPDKSFSHSIESNAISPGLTFVNLYLQQEIATSAELKSYLVSLAKNPGQTNVQISSSPSVFSSVVPSISKLKLASGGLLFDICTALPRKLCKDIYSDDIWGVGKLTSSDLISTLEQDDENMLPQQIFTQIGEHLLSLVQDLESFSSSNALSDLLKLTGSGDADALIVRDWKDLSTALDLREDEKIDNLSKRTLCINSITASEKALFGSSMSNFDGYEVSSSVSFSISNAQSYDGGEEQNDANVALSMTFVNEWLGAIAESVIGIIFAQIVRIPVLSPPGRAQLEVDLVYISNVINALGLRPHPMLVHTLHLISTEPTQLANSVESLSTRVSIAGALKKFDRRIVDALSAGYGISNTNINKI